MLGPPGFPNFPSVRGKSFSSEFSMLFADKESNIYVAEPHEAGAAVLNRHRYDVYDVLYIIYIYNIYNIYNIYIQYIYNICFGWDFEV